MLRERIRAIEKQNKRLAEENDFLGGAIQAITQSEIKLNTIEKLPKIGIR